MHRFRPRPTSPRQKETRSRPPCVRSICRLWLRNKTGRRLPPRRQTRSTITRSTRFSRSCDDAKSFHFPVKPDAVNDERNRATKRRDCAREINRRAFHEVDPDAPTANSEREQRREDDENNMEAFK